MMGRLYADSLSGVATEIEYLDGTRRPLEATRWREPIDGDESVLDRCAGPTLDVGSGPGRLIVALTRRGIPALGIDITPRAVRLTRRAGGPALVRDVFGDVPGSGTWATALLADGNIGIGGNPGALLLRIRELVRPGGEAVVEAEPPGTDSRVDRVRLRRADAVGGWFGWATVSVTDVVRLAVAGGFTTADCWREAGRWFAGLR
ncbi:class I SAM-dependent methyltransferase [Planobispora longispora]|uniref:Methyltransferase type 12 n=1 Tax=Planobispora longispora TaxID=28887 RepID=A0A8J3RQ45_9ACTN|nr:class I SAM-dependent methyltransferase [Planobispora longispora]BFE88444.1 class I SAM-dependent methyltransferase [Planobispora longispora]GIH79732.1 methyltransferase type 12 [Planobispora longispora]